MINLDFKSYFDEETLYDYEWIEAASFILEKKIENGDVLAKEEQECYDKIKIIYEYYRLSRVKSDYDKLLVSPGCSDAEYATIKEDYYSCKDKMAELRRINPNIDFKNRLVLEKPVGKGE